MLAVFFIVALIATLLALDGIAASATAIAGFLFLVFLVLFFVSLAMGVQRSDGA